MSSPIATLRPRFAYDGDLISVDRETVQRTQSALVLHRMPRPKSLLRGYLPFEFGLDRFRVEGIDCFASVLGEPAQSLHTIRYVLEYQGCVEYR